MEKLYVALNNLTNADTQELIEAGTVLRLDEDRAKKGLEAELIKEVEVLDLRTKGDVEDGTTKGKPKKSTQKPE